MHFVDAGDVCGGGVIVVSLVLFCFIFVCLLLFFLTQSDN